MKSLLLGAIIFGSIVANACERDNEHCEPKMGFFDEYDYRHGDRCPLLLGDFGSLALSPKSVILPPATAGASSTLEVSVIGFVDGMDGSEDDSENKLQTSADGYLVDVAIVDPSNNCDLAAFELVQGGSESGCTVLSPTRGRCVLDAAGVAQVTVSTRALAGKPESCIIEARSGKKLAQATLGVGLRPDDVSLAVEFSSAAPGCGGIDAPCEFHGGLKPRCSSTDQTPSLCSEVIQRASFVVQAMRGGSVIAPGEDFDLDLSMVQDSADAGAFGVSVDECEEFEAGLGVTLSGRTGSTEPLFVCVDGAGGEFELRAQQGSQPVVTRVSVPPLPALVYFNATQWELLVLDCNRRGVATTLAVTMTDGQVYLLQTDPSGVATVPKSKDDPTPTLLELPEWNYACSL